VILFLAPPPHSPHKGVYYFSHDFAFHVKLYYFFSVVLRLSLSVSVFSGIIKQC
jgi:hypothetical protein